MTDSQDLTSRLKYHYKNIVEADLRESYKLDAIQDRDNWHVLVSAATKTSYLSLRR